MLVMMLGDDGNTAQETNLDRLRDSSLEPKTWWLSLSTVYSSRCTLVYGTYNSLANFLPFACMFGNMFNNTFIHVFTMLLWGQNSVLHVESLALRELNLHLVFKCFLFVIAVVKKWAGQKNVDSGYLSVPLQLLDLPLTASFTCGKGVSNGYWSRRCIDRQLLVYRSRSLCRFSFDKYSVALSQLLVPTVFIVVHRIVIGTLGSIFFGTNESTMCYLLQSDGTTVSRNQFKCYRLYFWQKLNVDVPFPMTCMLVNSFNRCCDMKIFVTSCLSFETKHG